MKPKRWRPNKIAVGVLIVAFLCAAITLTLSLSGRTPPLRNAIAAIITPVQGALTSLTDHIDAFFAQFQDADELDKKIQELENTIAGMQNALREADQLREENEFLTSFLELKRSRKDFQFVQADVVGRETNNYRSFLTLNRGVEDGLSLNMPVITADGVLGYLSEVGTNWSRVVPLTETTAAAGAYAERSGAAGLIEGDFALRAEGRCRLSNLDPSADIQTGDRILTSGIGSVYPSGLYIGEVVEVKADAANASLYAVIQPPAALDQISRVMVITGFTREEEDFSSPEIAPATEPHA